MIAGSELKDLEPYFGQIHDRTGVQIELEYSGTLAGIDRIRSGEHFDAAWFANDKYLLLADKQHRVKAQERIMLSPVVIGVKESVAKRFGWTRTTSWKEIEAKAADGSFRYAMTNPTTSNSGFSAVIAVSTAFAGTGDVLRAADVDAARLRSFFRGQQLTAGSSGWLVDAYVRDQGQLDGIVNYEANLLALDKSSQLKERLVLIYPKEGVVTADYPLVLLDDAKRALYDKVIAYLKSDEFQQLVMEKTDRRPVDPNVKLAPEFPTGVVNEIAFPNSLADVDGVLLRYLSDNRVPAHSFYVLDTSGSMQGDRIDAVRRALFTLAGEDSTLTGKFARFQKRERITLISFSDGTRPPVDLEMHSAADPATLAAVKTYADNLQPGGATAIYCALEEALADANRSRQSEGARYYSIVLMTDGENNRCDDAATFEQKYVALPPGQRIKIFPILFGEGDSDALEHLAVITGGRMFDGRHEALSSVFKEIRGYQ
ncbi:MAG: substrate-binding and vWA domain-containing protein [Vulcanimicrobiaceae bacterium]